MYVSLYLSFSRFLSQSVSLLRRPLLPSSAICALFGLVAAYTFRLIIFSGMI